MFIGSKMMIFQNKRVRERLIVGCFSMAWSSLYKTNYVTKLELVEGKFSK